MKFSGYPEYKESGVEWVGKIPSQWKSGALRWLSKRYSGGTPDKSSYEFWENGSIPWLNSGSVNDKIILKPSAYITETAFNSSSAKWIPKGALVIALAGQGKTKGMVAQLGIDSTSNQSMAAIVPKEIISSRFLYYWIDSNYENIRNMAGGDLRDGLNLEMLGNIQCPIPSSDEQNIISKFLDHETEKIDRLVAAQEELIELLKEKRQSVIYQTVTKGLDPSLVKRKTEIDWLPEIPEKWKISKVKYLFYIGRGRVISQEIVEPDGLYPVYSSQTFNDGCFGYIDTYDFDCEQLTWTTDGANAGTVFLRNGKHNCTNVCGTLLPKSNDINLKYLHLWLTFATQFYKRPDTNGAKIINSEMAEIFLLLPSQSEQELIAKFLQLEISKFENLIAESKKVIEILQERRSALISAAVTGQIDVRNYQIKGVA